MKKLILTVVILVVSGPFSYLQAESFQMKMKRASCEGGCEGALNEAVDICVKENKAKGIKKSVYDLTCKEAGEEAEKACVSKCMSE